MSVSAGVVVPAVPAQPPKVTLLGSSVRPDTTSDPANPVFQVGDVQLALLPGDLRKEIDAQQRDSWVRGITYAPENHFTAVAHDQCDFASTAGSIDAPVLAAPTGVTAVPSSAGGMLTAGTKSYQVTAVDANGQTTALPAVTAPTTGSTGSVALTWNKTAETVTYNIYGRVAGSIGLIGSVGPFDDDQAATFTDTGSQAPGATVPTSNTTGGAGTYSNLPIVSYQPILMVVEDWCSSFGFSERDFKGRALRLLENAVPQAIEREFWTGALAQALGYPNNYLASPTCVDLTPATVPSVARGQQILQDYIASTGFGGQGMLHCQPQTAPNLLNARRVGPLLLDIFDNIIVPGVGYPGTGPVGNANFTPPAGQAWMYATDLVMTREEDEGTVFPDSFSEAFDWGQGGMPNTIRFRAMKHTAAYFDGAVQGAVRVQLTS